MKKLLKNTIILRKSGKSADFKSISDDCANIIDIDIGNQLILQGKSKCQPSSSNGKKGLNAFINNDKSENR